MLSGIYSFSAIIIYFPDFSMPGYKGGGNIIIYFIVFKAIIKNYYLSVPI